MVAQRDQPSRRQKPLNSIGPVTFLYIKGDILFALVIFVGFVNAMETSSTVQSEQLSVEVSQYLPETMQLVVCEGVVVHVLGWGFLSHLWR